MKIAFLISAYTDPKQLGNMIGALAAGNHWFFVHVDKKVDIAPFRDSVKGYERVTFVTNRHSVNWGVQTSALSNGNATLCHRKRH